MIQIKKVDEWREIRRKLHGKSIGFVPTMGYLHDGHASLLKKAKEDTDIVVLSIFVNPLQFGPQEDYDKYPRDIERDWKLAEQAGVDYLFTPEVEDMYPEEQLTTVSVKQITTDLCGKSRPTHFDGVSTVVMKLFNIVQPEQAFFGIKDAQQVAVITKMVQDLNMNVKIVPCPTIRDADGLALSSRNVYLNKEEREQATILYQSLQWASKELKKGKISIEEIKAGIIQLIKEKPLATIDYVEIRSFPDLREATQHKEKLLIAVAVKFGKTRLIDNLLFEI